MRKTLLIATALLAAGCRLSDVPPDAAIRALTDTTVPLAVAGEGVWKYQQRVALDFDGDGVLETAILTSDVSIDGRGVPLWEDGHRWQVYIEEPSGERTYVFRQFLPNGKLTADVVRRDSGTRSLLIIAQTPLRIGVYEVKYAGPQRIVLVNTIERPVEGAGTFTGSPRP